MSAEHVVEVPVPHEKVGLVIGREGKTLKRIERIFAVKLSLTSTKKAHGEKLSITCGAADTADRAAAYVSALLSPEQEVRVPDKKLSRQVLGLFIGLKGAHKEKLERETGVVAEVDEAERRIVIRGGGDGFTEAVRRVQKFVEEAQSGDSRAHPCSEDQARPEQDLDAVLVDNAAKMGFSIPRLLLDRLSKMVKQAYLMAIRQHIVECDQASKALSESTVQWQWKCDDGDWQDIPQGIAFSLHQGNTSGDQWVFNVSEGFALRVELSKMEVTNVYNQKKYKLKKTSKSKNRLDNVVQSSTSDRRSEGERALDEERKFTQLVGGWGFKEEEVKLCLRNGAYASLDTLLDSLSQLHVWYGSGSEKQGGEGLVPGRRGSGAGANRTGRSFVIIPKEEAAELQRLEAGS